MEFPIIYFQHAGQDKLDFIGDGSSCSYVKVTETPRGKSFDRFRITHASDLNHDGEVDVLEVNGAFTYEIRAKQAPLVIHYGEGC